jgi:hypothetical protein
MVNTEQLRGSSINSTNGIHKSISSSTATVSPFSPAAPVGADAACVLKEME